MQDGVWHHHEQHPELHASSVAAVVCVLQQLQHKVCGLCVQLRTQQLGAGCHRAAEGSRARHASVCVNTAVGMVLGRGSLAMSYPCNRPGLFVERHARPCRPACAAVAGRSRDKLRDNFLVLGTPPAISCCLVVELAPDFPYELVLLGVLLARCPVDPTPVFVRVCRALLCCSPRTGTGGWCWTHVLGSSSDLQHYQMAHFGTLQLWH